MSSARIVIFANGLLPDTEKARAILSPDDTVVCADGGTRHALALGLTPSVVIGDLDSLDLPDRTQLGALGARFVQHPVDKDETDLELAIEYALEQEPESILIVGALGGRTDQTLANISLLLAPSLSKFDCKLDDGIEELSFTRDHALVSGAPGDLVSLIPWGAPVTGVYTEGLRWPLRGETLYPDKTRSISNEMLSDSSNLRLESGLLLIVHRRNF